MSFLIIGNFGFHIHPSWAAKLITIDLTNCKLEKIPESLSLASYLESLILKNNLISDITPLLANKNLIVLNLARNMLKDFRESVFVLAELKKLEILEIKYLLINIAIICSYQRNR